MISYKKQLKILFIPILNCSIIFIVFFKNKFFLKKNWQLKLIPYYLGSILLFLPFFIIFDLLTPYFQLFIIEYGFSWFVSLVKFYPFSLIASSMLIIAQKRLVKTEYIKVFLQR